VIINNSFSKINKILEISVKNLKKTVEEKDTTKLIETTTFENLKTQYTYLETGIKNNKLLQKKLTFLFWEKHGKSTIDDKY
jgi:hypothetical protein